MANNKLELILEGLDCANCAAKIEKEINNLKEVKSTSLNFVTKKLVIESDMKNTKALVEEVKKIVINIEPGVNVLESSSTDQFSIDFKEILGILSAIIFLTVGFLTRQNKTLSLVLLGVSYILAGKDVLKRFFINLLRLRIFDESFLMTVATFGAIALKEYPEAVSVMLLYKIGTFLEDLAVNRSRKVINSLKNLEIEYANLKVGNEIRMVNPKDIVPNDIVIVRPSEKVPVDGTVINGASFVDTSAITGESKLIDVKNGDEVYAGYINVDGVLEVKARSFYKDSTISKIIELVENATAKKANPEKFITRFASIYTPAVVILAVLLTLIPVIFFAQPFSKWFYKSLLFLIISCPCALVISVPLSYFAGIAKLSSIGILVKGSSFIDKMAGKIYAILFDKTGTITEGNLKVEKIVTKEIEEEEFLRLLAHLESFSKHPVALSIIKEFKGEIDIGAIEDFKEWSGKGIEGTVFNKKVLAGTKDFLDEKGIEVDGIDDESHLTTIHLCVDNKYCGYVLLKDSLKADVKNTIEDLKRYNIKTYLLTGDKKEAALSIIKNVNFDKVFSELLPQEKLEIVNMIKSEAKKEKGGWTIFVGDGTNDSPALAQSDVGIAIVQTSDIAVYAADIVLLDKSIKKIIDLIENARFIRKIVFENIAFPIAVKILIMFLGILGFANMWEAIFADVGVSLIAVLNSLRIAKKTG